jgi:phosphomannomutase
LTKLTCFKAYDVRGRIGEELNEDLAQRIGRSFAQYLRARRVAVGSDPRLSSEGLKAALIKGLTEAGSEVMDMGLTGTEEIYHAVFSQKLDGGIEVTGSHNPLTDNGLKFVREDSRPISGDTGLNDIKALAQSGIFEPASNIGSVQKVSFKEQYVQHLLSYISPSELPPLKIVADCGNGAAGPVLSLLESRLKNLGSPLEFIKIRHQPDGSFPQGIPNPLLPENRKLASQAVIEHQADLGIAWDGDFDRCFFFDETGSFIEGYYLVGLLAEAFLERKPGATIIHDPRLTWNTIDIVAAMGGRPVESKTGHAFIKERMRSENAVYGGEMSAHHYFADFAYCDSGMIPWLLVVGLMGRRNMTLSKMVAERQAKFPCSGELNYRATNPLAVIDAALARYGPQALRVDRIDGLSLEMPEWRFNLRSSNTEPLLRLNIETRGDAPMVERLVTEMQKLISSTS